MIIVIAPYSTPHLCGAPNLGAATKIELVIQGPSRIGEVLLINTAHNQEGKVVFHLSQTFGLASPGGRGHC
jgi:hypothetical protein